MGGLYDHHGIYVGDDMVIHLQGKGKKLSAPSPCNKCGNKRFINGEIEKVCIDCFLEGETVQIYDYGIPFIEFANRKLGTCSSIPSKPPHEVIATAVNYLEKGFAPYDMISNNCEHFAVYCKTGTAVSHQVVLHTCNIL
ncbi:lecithin retinol acyltransferase-like [Hibiscus syriacus]|uniref:lecithin retinol acyltransferase-like n=1 Tax=Hibiscus syriacus TaxID=106335 RepID=UPI001924C197|nr:lecithin retinol acyltransferase-like [Hibiscus syriacus]